MIQFEVKVRLGTYFTQRHLTDNYGGVIPIDLSEFNVDAVLWVSSYNSDVPITGYNHDVKFEFNTNTRMLRLTPQKHFYNVDDVFKIRYYSKVESRNENINRILGC